MACYYAGAVLLSIMKGRQRRKVTNLACCSLLPQQLISSPIVTKQNKGEGKLRVADLAKLTTLRYLDLSHNELEFFPGAFFAKWPRMERLWLSHNMLTVLPVEISQLAATLEEVHLEHNRLEALPIELAKLNRLRVLKLDDNTIAELPAQLGVMTQLEQLDVGTQNGRLRYPLLQTDVNTY